MSHDDLSFGVELCDIAEVKSGRDEGLRIGNLIDLTCVHEDRYIEIYAAFDYRVLHGIVHCVLMVHFYADKSQFIDAAFDFFHCI